MNALPAKPPRGSFPKGAANETPPQKRERYELWVLATHSRLPDMEANSISFYRGRTKMVSAGPGTAARKEVPAQPSRRLCVDSRCWQCVHGDDDPNGQQRIGDCTASQCPLWPVRPYQVTAPAASRVVAIRSYCLDCMGGKAAEVPDCKTVTCALFPARKGASKSAGNAQPEQTETEAGND